MTLLNNPIGNEVMSREQLLKIVPIFVAVLVWLTRILYSLEPYPWPANDSYTVMGCQQGQRSSSGHP